MWPFDGFYAVLLIVQDALVSPVSSTEACSRDARAKTGSYSMKVFGLIINIFSSESDHIKGRGNDNRRRDYFWGNYFEIFHRKIGSS